MTYVHDVPKRKAADALTALVASATAGIVEIPAAEALLRISG
jgi:hypothetical protein